MAEMLIVIAIIILFIAMALPAFNLMSGSRSIGGAENQVAAFLGRAHAEAIGVQGIRGVGFYQNAYTGRYGMAIVQQPFTDPSISSAFNSAAKSYPAYSYVTYNSKYFVAKMDLTGNPVAPPPSTGDDANWAQTDINAIDAVGSEDMIELPPGVGAQLINNCGFTGSTRTSNGYVSYGAILFDGSGKLVSKPVSICHAGLIGTRANLTAENLPSLSSSVTVRSQVGVALFDVAAYKNAGGSVAYQGIFAAPSPVYSAGELAQETWLDKNSTPLLVNRFNGTLVKGE